MSLFVDTSVWYANLDSGDGSHAAAARIIAEHDDFVLSELILAETWRLAASRLGPDHADRFWEYVMAGGATLEHVTHEDLDRAWLVRRSFPDQRFSLVDCTSFVLMERLGVTRVAAFDDDFAIYRYGLRRNRAFELVR